jgi:lysophospholipid acyltransferase (LPLAT)-like uncharacterized protein
MSKNRERRKKPNILLRAILWIFPPLYKGYMHFVFITSRRIFYNFARLQELDNKGENILGIAWHQDAVFGPFAFRNRNIMTMVSKGDPGEVIAPILKKIGYIPIRGGSSRGGSEALAEVLEYFHTHKRLFCALSADGSRGPFRKLKKGILVIARESGAPVFPVRTWARLKILLPTWDRTLIPLPFNTLLYFCGEPVYVTPDADAETLEAKRKELEDNLMNLVRRSEEYYAGKIPKEYPNESKIVQYGKSTLFSRE